MKCVALCCVGIEDILAGDIKRIINKDSEQQKGVCLFDASNNELAKFAYLAQSIERTGALIKQGKIKTP